MNSQLPQPLLRHLAQEVRNFLLRSSKDFGEKQLGLGIEDEVSTCGGTFGEVGSSGFRIGVGEERFVCLLVGPDRCFADELDSVDEGDVGEDGVGLDKGGG